MALISDRDLLREQMEAAIKTFGDRAYDRGYMLGVVTALTEWRLRVARLLQQYERTEDVRIDLEYGDRQ